MAKNVPKEKVDAAKTNLQVCSILLAAVSLTLKLSDLPRMFNWLMVIGTVSIWLAILFLVIAIFLEADAVFYYSRAKEEFGDYFDKYGYKAMKGGLFFILNVINYLAFWSFSSIIVVPGGIISSEWSDMLQASTPTIITLIIFISWRIFKCRKIHCKWYRL